MVISANEALELEEGDTGNIMLLTFCYLRTRLQKCLYATRYFRKPIINVSKAIEATELKK